MKNKTLWFLVLVGTIVRLLIIFDQKQIIKLPDSELYLSLTKDYFQGNFHPNLVRTPGYSFFIYIIFLIFGWGKLKIVFLIQHFLTLVSCILIFKILEKRIRSRALLLFVSILMFTSYSVAQWGQILMPEALLIFFTSLFFFLTLYLSRSYCFLVSVLSFITLLALGFIKPIYLSFSFIYLAYLFFSQKNLRRIVIFEIIVLIFITSGYMFWNKSKNGFFGVSASDSTTVFGKIVNFNMENCSSEKNLVFARQLQNYLSKDGKRDWYQFVYSYSKNSWGENLQTFQKTYEFNNNVIKHCPIEYFSHSASSIWQTLFTYKNYLTSNNQLIKITSALSVADYLWGLLFIVSLPFTLKKKGFTIITLFILYNLFSIFLFAADSFYRLRVPFQLLFYLYLILCFEKKDSRTEEKTAKSKIN